MLASRLCSFAVALLCALFFTPAALATTAFVHVNVVPMDRERVIADQTVLVEDGIIKAIGRDIVVPAAAQVIDGKGRFLSPGLADMHSHAQSREEMKVYLANGVTTLLNLGGASSDFIDQRMPLLNRGERPGPYVYAALRIDGTPRYGQLVVTTPDEASWAVRLARTNGYRFIKVYNTLSPETFAATMDEARKLGLGVAGHNVEAVRIPAQLAAGQSLVAHLEELVYGLFTPPADDPLAAPGDALIAQAVDVVKRNHGYVVADLFTFQTIAEQWGHPDAVAGYFAKPEARFVPFDWRLDWRRQDYVRKSGSLAQRAAFMARLAKALDDAGVGLLAGTDAPTIPGIVAGYSLHDDLTRLSAAGLSNYRALATATRTPGRYIAETIHGTPPFGQVQPGYRADLILSDDNPLQNLATLRAPAGVMAHGHWHDRAALAALLDQVLADYAAVAGR
jgi:hypothetical protein